MEKRFQECGFFGKLFRYRFYLTIPFRWLYHMYIKPIEIIDDEYGSVFIPRYRMLLSILKGEAQSKMKWYWTSEEVFEKIRNKYK